MAQTDMINRGLQIAIVPCTLEQAGVDRGMVRDDIAVFPFSNGRSLCRDTTCADIHTETDTCADIYTETDSIDRQYK